MPPGCQQGGAVDRSDDGVRPLPLSGCFPYNEPGKLCSSTEGFFFFVFFSFRLEIVYEVYLVCLCGYIKPLKGSLTASKGAVAC